MRKFYLLMACLLVLAVTSLRANASSSETSTFVGTIQIDLAAMGGEIETVEDQQIEITPTAPGQCTFALYHFIFGTMGDVGDIVIENVTMGNGDNGETTYQGSKKNLTLAGGSIIVDVTVDGVETAQGNIVMNIGVSMMMGLVQIPVTFEGAIKAPAADAITYVGTVAVYTSEIPTLYEDQTVTITNTGEGLCTFSLYNFMFNGAPIGDIIIENVVKAAMPDGSIVYEGKKDGLSLAGGTMIVNVTCQGQEANGRLIMQIGVDVFGQTMPVIFTGDNAPSGIQSAATDINAPATYYRINGTEATGDLIPGIYIKRQGNKSTKIIVR